MTQPSTAVDVVDERLVSTYRAALAPWLFDVPAGTAPLGLHWCLFPTLAPTSELGADGHPPRQHDVDIVAFPRRMWVGGSLEFVELLPLDCPVFRQSTQLPVEVKNGRSGRLALTGSDHVLTINDRPVVRERQNIVFRPAATELTVQVAGEPSALPRIDAQWKIPTPPTLLFRYSALTSNAHRIHYDLDYAQRVELYPDLLVHGPLQATLLANLAATVLERVPHRFEYRAEQPLYAGGTLHAVATLDETGVTCIAHDGEGRVSMRSHAC
jgi:3-methylfumaryl-CoA hydratase